MLKAKNNKLIDNFIKSPFLEKIKNKHSTPLHILFPENFSQNIGNFKRVLKSADIKYEVFYAHKSNKSKIFLDICKEEKIGVDVSSKKELENALQIGISKIEASGPKNMHFLEECIKNNIPICIDSFSEIESIIDIRKDSNVSSKTPILIRISGFTNSQKSRFGIEISKKDIIINLLQTYQDSLDFLGCSFHIDSESLEEKAKAIEEIFLFYQTLQKNKIRAKIINIGGGFGISYLEEQTQWEKYKALLKEEVINPTIEMSWKKQGYGFYQEGNAVIGDGKIYTPHRETYGAGYLETLLDYTLPQLSNITIKDYIKENFLTLWIEPGRSLHDETGITITQVISTKEITNEILITLDINSFQMGCREQELFTDPIIIGEKMEENQSEKGVFFTGNLCLESDFIYKHKSFLGYIPQKGNIVIFKNTGGYLMDFYETESISHPLPQKIVYFSNGNFYAL